LRLPVSAALVCVAFLPAAVAQTPPPAAHIPTLSSRSTLVLVPALVRDKSNELVFNLKADDFLLTDDGIPQKLNLEADADREPLALVVLIEAGAASRSAGWHPNAAGPPADRFRPLASMMDAVTGDVPSRVAVVGFDSGPELLLNFTHDMDAVTDSIHYLDTNIDGDGGAAILDSIGYAVDLLRQQPPEYRRAILLLSESNDRGSKLKLEQALRAISDTNTAIYSLAYSTGNTDASQYASQELPTKRRSVHCASGDAICTSVEKMASSPDQSESTAGTTLSAIFYGITLDNPNPGPAHGCMSGSDPAAHAAKNPAIRAFDCLGLLVPPLAIAKVGAIAASEDLQPDIPETVARLAGGEYFKISDARSLETGLGAISNHMPNRYVLSFQPQAPHSGFHSLNLELPDHADLKVSARNGYWAETPSAPANQFEGPSR